MKKFFYLLLVLLTLLSCSEDKNEWITATIKEGEHTSTIDRRNIPAKRECCIEMLFDESNRTDTTYNAISKVYGVSDGYNHMKHSVRIGYRYFAERGDIAIYAFSHIDDSMTTHSSNILGYCDIGEISYACYKITNDKYIYKYKEGHIEHDRGRNSRAWIMYTLKPYFGGGWPAPHEMKVRYREYISTD